MDTIDIHPAINVFLWLPIPDGPMAANLRDQVRDEATPVFSQEEEPATSDATAFL
jgi:hypothetical protein